MTIAGGIILIMLGAILTWAVEFDVAGLDINIIGVILMLGGLAGLLFGIYRISVARRAVASTTTIVEDPVTHQRRVYGEHRQNDPPVV
jgi:hypothetical protein